MPVSASQCQICATPRTISITSAKISRPVIIRPSRFLGYHLRCVRTVPTKSGFAGSDWLSLATKRLDLYRSEIGLLLCSRVDQLLLSGKASLVCLSGLIGPRCCRGCCSCLCTVVGRNATQVHRIAGLLDRNTNIHADLGLSVTTCTTPVPVLTSYKMPVSPLLLAAPIAAPAAVPMTTLRVRFCRDGPRRVDSRPIPPPINAPLGTALDDRSTSLDAVTTPYCIFLL